MTTKQYKMQIMKIKGKEYIPVNERLKFFRSEHKDGSIQTEIVSNTTGLCIIKACVFIGRDLVATGHAYEKEGSSYINKTSYIENCETSAIGRALGVLGIGIDTSIASANEINHANMNANKKLMTGKQSDKFIKFCKAEALEPKEIAVMYGITKSMSHVAFKNTFAQINKAVESGEIGYRHAVPDVDKDEPF